MINIDAIIVEDSLKNREALLELLKEECPQVRVLGEADNLADAYSLIKKIQPGLVFLDIQLKEGTTFDLLGRLYNEGRINFEIIFITAYGKFEYTTKAIEYSALDFITKPINSQKLLKAVKKAEQKIGHQQYAAQIELLIEILNKPTNVSNRIAFHLIKGVIEFVEVKDIIYLEADGTVTNIYLSEDRKLIALRNLGYYIKLLMSDYNFFPISNKHLVHLNYIKRYKHSELTVWLINGKPLIASRRGGQDFKKFLTNNKDKFGKLQQLNLKDLLKKWFGI